MLYEVITTFEKSKLDWARMQSAEGQAILAYYQALIAMKRAGELGPRELGLVKVEGDHARELIIV